MAESTLLLALVCALGSLYAQTRHAAQIEGLYRRWHAQLTDGVVRELGYPNVCAVTGDTNGTLAAGEGTDLVAVAGLQLCDGIALEVAHVNGIAIETDTEWRGSGGEFVVARCRNQRSCAMACGVAAMVAGSGEG